MKSLANYQLLGIALLLLTGLGACDGSGPGPAESAGKKLDDATQRAGMNIDAALNQVGDKLDEKNRKVGMALADTEITAKVKSAFYSEPGLKSLRIGVDTVKGVVTLTGSVDSPCSLDRAKTLAQAVPGVGAVNNELRVTMPTR